MEVKLLNSYKDEKIAEIAAAVCVDKLDNITSKGKEVAINSGHLSIAEHLPLTFLIKKVSRSLTHQLVRHRIASYSQLSQRYAKVNTNIKWFVVPESITKSPEGLFRYMCIMDSLADDYNWFINNGIPKEDARYILPNACYTTILVTINARAFIEQCERRRCNRAQWEIRELYNKMKDSIKDIYPTIYKLCTPKCNKIGCTELRPCKNPVKD